MSNIYIQEPPTDGKVLLETSVGDIEIELWSKETPKACRNFVQLCMEGYYNKTIFHRVVKDFIVQGGDPTGTGHGGDSIYDDNFKDEFHSRLRFVRRGLVAMANNGEKDSNSSQFFFTMASTPELQNKHTIFGKISGNTIYNVMRLQEGIIGEDDRPEHPHKIKSSKVIANPFTDIIPRENTRKNQDKKEEVKVRKSKMKATKDFKLLSFGDEAEEEEEDLTETLKKQDNKKSGKSAHDLLNDNKLSKEVGIKSSSKNSDNEDDDDKSYVTQDISESGLSKIRNKLASKSVKRNKIGMDTKHDDNEDEIDEFEDEEQKAKRLKTEEIKKEIKKLKKDLKGDNNEKVDTDDGKNKKRVFDEEEKSNDILMEFHGTRDKFAEVKKSLPTKKSSAREDMTMKLLAKFKAKLHSAPKDDEEESKSKEDKDNIDEDSNWLGHTLKFQSDDPILAKDASSKDDEWFDIFDPRNPLNKRRRGESSKVSKNHRR